MTLVKALRRPGYLATAWPWRATVHQVTGQALTLAVDAGIFVTSTPWWVALARLRTAGPDVLTVTLLIAGTVTVAGLAPGLAELSLRAERLRPSLLGLPALPGRSRHGWSLRTVYASPWTARSVAYLATRVLLGTVVAVLVPVLALSGVVLLLAPLLVSSGTGPVAFGFWQTDSTGQAWFLVPAGALLIAGLGYLMGGIAAVESAAIRSLLNPEITDTAIALVEVKKSRRRLVDSFDAERRQLERNLHDVVQQRLVSLGLRLAMARTSLPEGIEGLQDVVAAHEQIKELLVVVRELVAGFDPRTLREHGLEAALDELAELHPVNIAVNVANEGPRLTYAVESTLFFGIAEAVTNASVHGHATQIEIEVSARDDAVRATVRDNGHGGADPARGTGLVGIADRLAVINGRVRISSPVGGPTVLEMNVS